jgi:tRNA(Leu) C34 or U34 (ribose-2'-O)-methylase TrmL
MGAVIGMKNVTADRRKLIDIGAAGPLAGLAVAIPVILYGLSKSQVAPLPPVGELEGNSLLYAWLKYLSKGMWLPDGKSDVFLHPTAWAGWAGLLVTMINMLPIGQLDGGHIATAYFGDRYNAFARRLHAFMPLVAVGVFAWVYHLAHVEMGAHWQSAVGVELARIAAMPWLAWFGLVWAVRRLGGGVNHLHAGAIPGVADRGGASQSRRRHGGAPAMKVPPFELPVEQIRDSLASLRRPLSVAILRARNPFNVGAIIRVAHSFLAREIILVGSEPYYERASMGMERYETIVNLPDEGALIRHVRAQGRKLIVFEKEAARVDLWHADLPEDCVMLFGSETTGVPDELVAAADLVVGIPMYGINHSFPVTVAAGIAMAEWTRRHFV